MIIVIVVVVVIVAVVVGVIVGVVFVGVVIVVVVDHYCKQVLQYASCKFLLQYRLFYVT